MVKITITVDDATVALRKESVDRNSRWEQIDSIRITSLSARRAWIEIDLPRPCAGCCRVALRKESVDRNEKLVTDESTLSVALRKESVDRNTSQLLEQSHSALLVALRKESVDRNVLWR